MHVVVQGYDSHILNFKNSSGVGKGEMAPDFTVTEK